MSENIFLIRKQYPKDDLLSYLIIPKHQRLYIFLLYWVVAFIEISGMVISWYITNTEQDFRKRFLSLLLSLQLCVISCLIIINTYGPMKNSWNEINKDCLEWTSAGDRIHKKIVTENKFHKLLSDLHAIFLVGGGSLCILLIYLLEIHNLFLAIKDCGLRYDVVLPVFGLWYITSALSMISVRRVLMMEMYVALHIKYQLYILNEHLLRITDDAKQIGYNDKYQNIIYHRLTFCIRLHIKIKRFSHNLLKIGKWSVLGFTFGGICLHAGLISYTLVGDSNKNVYYAVPLLMIVFVYGFAYYHYGQQIQDESMRIYETATTTDWYNWSKKNRMALQLLLINSETPIKYTCLNLVDLDYQLCLKIWKSAYTVVAVFVK